MSFAEQKLRFMDDSLGVELSPARNRKQATDPARATAPRTGEQTVQTVVNPFRDDPHPAVVWSVKRFGIVGLLVSAACSGVARWFHR